MIDATETNERFLARLLGGDFLLWSPNIQAEGFLHWDKIFATRRIRRGTPKPFSTSGSSLNITYEENGRLCTVEDLMADENMSGVLVLKNCEVVEERYRLGLDREHRWQSSSMVKSLASTLVGAAVHDGLIDDLDQLVIDFLPDFIGTAYDDVSIKHLLTMSSGVSWTENTDDLKSDVAEHYIKAIADRRSGYIPEYLKTRQRVTKPGTLYYYNTGDTFLLGLILSKVTEMTVSDYCSEKIWVPTGMEQDGYFLLDADEGQEVVGSCCGMTLRDYAKFGQFMIDDGVAGGVRILPEGWVEEATTPSEPEFAFSFSGERGSNANGTEYAGYGYLWWLNHDSSYMALGSYGQWLYINPIENVVVVMLAAVPRPVYMSADALEAAGESSHLGAPSRKLYIEAALAALR